MIKLQKTSQTGYPIVYQTGSEYARSCWAAEVIGSKDGTWRLCTNSSQHVCNSEQDMREYCERWGWTF